MKESIDNLKNNRFSISPESLEILKEVKMQFRKLKAEIPELSGIGFFGSRTVGTEKPESDVDCILFTDSKELSHEKMNRDAKTAKIIEVKLNSPQKINDSPILFSVMGIVDISREATDRDMAEFKHLVKEQKGGNLGFTKGNTTMPHPSAGSLITRFFLGIGDGLYKNRKYILEKLSHEKDGEILWQKILEYLSYFERTGKTTKRSGLPQYEYYPKTIAEARKFFINV